MVNVSVIVAIVTLVGTVIIDRMQRKQNCEMNEQNQKLNERDKRRHDDMIYADLTEFILKYSSPEHILIEQVRRLDYDTN
mgnify:CR=1 FL=1